ncbi:hypothetical protein AB0L97_06975 [Nocardia sp. NPDC051911]|uniref:hypothetical protein n=1 Tax=Nocardia sp. NPDC051911 TaxID=3154648 RepID=UPI003434638E
MATSEHIDNASAARLRALTSSRAWQQASAMEEAVIRPVPAKSGPAPAPPVSIADWRSVADQVNSEVVALWGDQNQQAADTAAGRSRDSLLTGAAVSGATAPAFLLSPWLANRLIGRLRRLRSETLAPAEVRLCTAGRTSRWQARVRWAGPVSA